MWISKDGDERKQELLDTAMQLFFEHGYDKTSINDIIGKVGVTKGAFYYYFKSKEDILESIAEQHALKLMGVLQRVSNDKGTSAIQKLNMLLSEVREYSISNVESRAKMFMALESDENTRLARRIHKNVASMSLPLIKQIIMQGIEEKDFIIDFPDETAELYISLSSIYKNSMLKLIFEMKEKPDNYKILERQLRFFENTLEKIFGVQNGAIEFAEEALKCLRSV